MIAFLERERWKTLARRRRNEKGWKARARATGGWITPRGKKKERGALGLNQSQDSQDHEVPLDARGVCSSGKDRPSASAGVKSAVIDRGVPCRIAFNLGYPLGGKRMAFSRFSALSCLKLGWMSRSCQADVFTSRTSQRTTYH